jgi:hypothetical protein
MSISVCILVDKRVLLTIEDANVNSSFLLVEVTPTAANIVGWKTSITHQHLVQQA